MSLRACPCRYMLGLFLGKAPYMIYKPQGLHIYIYIYRFAGGYIYFASFSYLCKPLGVRLKYLYLTENSLSLQGLGESTKSQPSRHLQAGIMRTPLMRRKELKAHQSKREKESLRLFIQSMRPMPIMMLSRVLNQLWSSTKKLTLLS